MAAIAAAAALWAGAAIVARNLFEAGVAPLELAEARAVVAAIGLAALGLRGSAPAGRVRRRRVGRGQVRRAHILALGLSIALVNGAYYVAIDRVPVAVAIVLQYTAPALVVSWTALVERRRPGGAVLAALVAAMLGVTLVVELPRGHLEGLDRVGIAFGLASAVLFAAYTLFSEKVVRTYGPLGAMLRAFFVAAIFWVAYQIPNGWPAQLFEPAALPSVLFVGVAGTLTPFLLYVWGIRRVAAERATIAATLEPVLAAVAAWLWLGQALSAMQIAGGLLVLGAVALLQVRRAGPVPVPEP